MPGLTLFGRKWLIASDDLVIPFIIEAVIRGILTITTSVILWITLRDSDSSIHNSYIVNFLFILLMDLIISFMLCCVIAYFSSRGTTLQAEKRSLLSYFLYMKMSTVLFDVFMGLAFTWMIYYYKELHIVLNSSIVVFAEIICFCTFGYLACVIIGASISYSGMGSLKFWKNSNISHSYILHKSTNVWKRRLKYSCCCWVRTSKTNHRIYGEIASFLASFFPHIDLVPTDVIAGLVILHQKHSMKQNMTDKSGLYNNLNGPCNLPSWMTPENALCFLGLAKSTYSCHLSFSQCDPCRMCSMITNIRGLFCHKKHGRNINEVNLCCHYQAALEHATGLNIKDIVYVSLKNAIYEPAFFIAVDHQKSSIVICIRGTFSCCDLVTDIDAESEKVVLQHCSSAFFCHRGTLRSAKYVHKKIEDSNILKAAFHQFPSYRLVVVGHSMGGSIGAMLGLLLRRNYPSLRCFAYGPLAVLCAKGAELTYDFVMTVTIGHDMSPRLCVKTCHKLREEIIHSLQECDTEKYKIMFGAFTNLLKNKPTNNIVSGNHGRKNIISTVDQLQSPPTMSKQPHLYAPGRILHLETSPNIVVSHWKTGLDFQSLTVGPSMIKDHQPRAIHKILTAFVHQESLKESIADKCVLHI